MMGTSFNRAKKKYGRRSIIAYISTLLWNPLCKTFIQINSDPRTIDIVIKVCTVLIVKNVPVHTPSSYSPDERYFRCAVPYPRSPIMLNTPINAREKLRYPHDCSPTNLIIKNKPIYPNSEFVTWPKTSIGDFLAINRIAYKI
jgi:hypothetical protein